ANVCLSGADELEGQAERWAYFFEAGCSSWFEAIKAHTFRSTFIDLHSQEASVIVEHWERRRQICAASDAEGRQVEEAKLCSIFEEAASALEPLRLRLHAAARLGAGLLFVVCFFLAVVSNREAVQTESAASSAGLAFVKLSTRSPKDSRVALAKAKAAYEARLASMSPAAAGLLDDNERWKILSEEVTVAGAVPSGTQGLELLLTSERVWEDLEFALRGPDGLLKSVSNSYQMSIAARAWDPRVTLRSEFRGIAWNGRLTCLCQYFHPLFFPELLELKATIEADCCEKFSHPEVTAAVESLGGHCIIDFAWLGKGEVVIVELNPFDGSLSYELGFGVVAVVVVVVASCCTNTHVPKYDTAKHN
ncbi:unnamed protein product, partial [Polarella glacialis]